MEGNVKTEYEALQRRLQALLQALETHSDTKASPMVASKITGIRQLIEGELKSIEKKPGEKPHGRLLMAKDDEENILGCFRRMQEYMDRLSLDTSVSMWKLEDEKSKDRISSSVRLLPSSPSAWYNSSAGAGIKRRECTPGTRVDVIANLLAWANGSSMDAVYWLNGMAGTGKTTIAYSVCKELSDKRTLAASFFCSRLREECRDVNRIIPSIAYQLARFSPAFQSALSTVMEEDQDAHHRVLTEQFQMLIQRPLLTTISNNPLDPVKMVVVIDALDECEDKDAIQDILGLLLKHAVNLPIRFIVSSRPEPQIRDLMIDEQVKAKLVLHELDTGDVQVDIETYVREELKPMNPPPAESQIAALVAKAGILFIYAATAVRYVGYDNFRHNPDARLRTLLDAQDGQKTQSRKKNQEIDGLYTTVLDAALNDDGLEDEERSDIEQVLRTVMCAYDPLTVASLSELLQIHNTGRVRAALRPLWSVLHIVGVDELVTTLHASFPDFMLDPARSKVYCCDSEVHNRILAEHCMERIGKAQPHLNICGLESSYLPDRSISNIEERVSNAISPDLLYACRYWADHVQAGKCALTLVEKLRDFLCTRLLLWIEVLNLKKHIKTSMECMKLVVEWCKQLEDDRELVELANDAQRFVESFASNPVSQSTPHIYVSMLAFWPRDAPVAKHYARSTCGPVEAEGTSLDQRQSAHISTWTFKAGVTEMAVSRDGRYVALGIEKEVVVVDSSTGQIVLGPLYSPDDRCIAGVLAGEGRITPAIHLWDAIDHQTMLGPLKGHTDYISSIVFSPDGSRIISGCSNGLVCTWDVHQRNLPSTSMNTASIDILSAKFSSDGMRFVTGSKDGLLHIWDSYTGELCVGPIKAHTSEIVAVDFWNDRVVSGSEDGTVSVWNALSGEVVLASVTTGPEKAVTAVAYSSNGDLIVTTSRINLDSCVEVNLWDAHTGTRVLGPLKDAPGDISTIQFSPDGTRIAGITRTYGSETGVWDTSDGRKVSEPYEHRIQAESISYSPNGAFIVLGHRDKTITLWDAYIRTKELKRLTGHSSRVNSVHFSPDSTRLVSSADETIWIWDVQTGQMLFELPHGHEEQIISVAYSPDGTRIISISYEGSVRIHDARTNQERALSCVATEYSDWTMNKDGWVVDDQSRLLVWVPPDLRRALLQSRTQVAIASWGYVRLKFDKSRMGESWEKSFVS
ncbi:unnamed protein product [Rhizoctonia solani]|uniref:NACHT domain-containing protein n=1 Tax=Rhizoctonia solani TaxID=456999 RepID=A0A8H3CZF0_9AGAM|nr:unnamed protein product [Rhizoctonia solani]